VRQTFTKETQKLLDAADHAIARSQDLVKQRRKLIADCAKARRQRELRWIFRHSVELQVM